MEVLWLMSVDVVGIVAEYALELRRVRAISRGGLCPSPEHEDPTFLLVNHRGEIVTMRDGELTVQDSDGYCQRYREQAEVFLPGSALNDTCLVIGRDGKKRFLSGSCHYARLLRSATCQSHDGKLYLCTTACAGYFGSSISIMSLTPTPQLLYSAKNILPADVRCMLINSKSELFVAVPASPDILVCNDEGKVLRAFGSTDCAELQHKLRRPTGMAFDAHENIFVVDASPGPAIFDTLRLYRADGVLIWSQPLERPIQARSVFVDVGAAEGRNLIYVSGHYEIAVFEL